MLRLLRILFYQLSICLLTFTLVRSASGQAPPQALGDLVWISFDSNSELADLANYVDIWEVNKDRGAVVALISGEEAKWLVNAGYTISTYDAVIQHPHTIPGYSCYRTIDEQNALLDSWTQLYPQLAQTSTLGYSYEGREMRILQLKNVLTNGVKPVFFLMANIHGRELITNEAALEFAQYLLERYSVNPDITWLLDHHIIYVLASANPDGHVRNEPGEPWAWWRKNTQPYGECDTYSYGVDLNRNAAFMWGSASADPCNELYQGPLAASEPESVVIADFLRSVFADQRDPGLTDPASVDTSGIFITLHSYGDLILWPWAGSYSPAPNDQHLTMLGGKLATYNGYEAKAGSDLYPASGTSLDFAYGELGVASFLFELGTSADGFYPSCSRYNAIIESNIQAFIYAAKVARSPYETAFGPDIDDVITTPPVVIQGAITMISALADDTQNGNNAIAAVELTVDFPPWEGGVTTVLTATDTLFDSPVEYVGTNLDTSQYLPGKHLVFLRGMDTAGHWGPVSAAFLDVVSPTYEFYLPFIMMNGD